MQHKSVSALAGALALLFCATPSFADACDTLIGYAQGQMSLPSTTPAQKSQLEALLQAGRAAKQAGNLQACEAAMQSPAPGNMPGHKCEKSQNTV